MLDYTITKDEKDFFTANCPLKINRNTFRKYYLYTIAKEVKTKREILFYQFKQKSVSAEDLGNLILLASGMDTDIIIGLVKEKTTEIARIFQWLQKNSAGINFILIEAPI